MGYRYIGSKTTVMSEVLSSIKMLCPTGTRVCDLMCGTGVVSEALRGCGYRVIAADVMTYSYHHARTLLLFVSEPTFDSARDFIVERGGDLRTGLFESTAYGQMLQALQNTDARDGYFFREFCPDGSPANGVKPRCYFSTENARKIDGIRYWIKKLRETGVVTDLEHSLLLHDLIMAANDVANIAGTYGHHLATLKGRAGDPISLSPTRMNLRDDQAQHTVLRGKAEELASSIRCDFCYIDPPYMKRQYAANYHVLETLAREDCPEAAGVSGLRPWRDQYSNFCTKTKIRGSFSDVFRKMDCSRFLVSYSQDGLLSLDELTEFFSTFGKVTVDTFTHKRFRSNNSDLLPDITEYLLLLDT